MVTTDLAKQQKTSVQTLPKKDEVAQSAALFYWGFNHGDVLLPWGTRERDVQLNRYSYAMHNTLFAGALTNLAKDIASTPWELDGGKSNKKYYQELLLSADFNGGWRNFILKLVHDYGVLDRGAFIELAGGGKPDKPIRGRVTGIHPLDPIRCIPTGDPEFPVVYNAIRGDVETYHLMHYTRVYRFTDMPSSDEWLRERGLANQGQSGLSRFFGYYYSMLLMGKYNWERLSDQPPLGIVSASNVTDLAGTMRLFEAQRKKEGQGLFRGLMDVTGVDPGKPVDVNFIPFSNLPEGFNQKEATEIHARMVALALGVDPQDVMPLTGQAMGTGAQSKVLDDKARGKSKGDLLRIIERFINTSILPPGMEFRFTEPDDEKGKAAAERGQVWVSLVNEIQGITGGQRLKILANNVPEIANVILGEDGEIELPDDDVKTDAQISGGLVTDTDNPDQEATDIVEGEFADVEVTDAAVEKAQQIFAYHIEHGVVTKDEVRKGLGFEPVNDPLEQEFSDKHTALKLVQAAVNAQIPLEEALKMAHLDILLPKETDEQMEEQSLEDDGSDGQTPIESEAASDEGETPAATPAPSPRSADTESPNEEEETRRRGVGRRKYNGISKAFTDTREQFERNVADVLQGALDKSITRRRAGIVMRGHLNKSGRAAMMDGLRDTGSPTAVLSPTERQIFNRWLIDQSAFVTSALNNIYQNDLQFDPDARAKVWANKSLTDIYYKGMLQGDRDPNMKFVGSDGKESCRTCKRLKGRVYKLSTWIRRGLVPQKDTDKYECGGYNCEHRLDRTSERASTTRLREWLKGYEHETAA